MPNQIDSLGIQIETLAEIINDIINGTSSIPGVKQIYGNSINVDSNSPDGQILNIFALSKKDILDLIVQDYNSKDPDQAVGVALDAVSQLCGIYRQGGTYTEVEVTVNVDRTLTLNGLDTSTPFTISDSNGNLFNLITSVTIDAGDNLLDFRTQEIGFIQILAGTLTIPIDKILGVVSVTNASTPYLVGQDQETDAAFRLRRQASTALPAQGFLQSLLAGLNTITGLAEAVVYENVTNDVVDDVPGHSIWVIVDGGTDEDVANMIYKYRNAGCGMKGSQKVTITQIDGSNFDIYFERAAYENLGIQIYVDSLSGILIIDEDALKTALVAQYLFGIYEEADITTLTSLVHSINSDLLVTAIKIRKPGGAWVDSVYPSYKQNKFLVTTDEISIISDGESSSSSSRSSSSSSSCRSSSSSSSSCRSSSSSSLSSSSSSCRSSSSSSSCMSSSSSRSSSSSSSSSG